MAAAAAAPLPHIPWGLGVNMREAAYYGTGNFGSADLNAHLDFLHNIGVNRIRFFASRIEFSAAQCTARVEATLNALDARGMKAIVCITDAFSASGFVIREDAIWHKVPNTNGQIHKDYWLQHIYRDPNSYLAFARTMVSRLRSHRAVLAWELGNEFAIHPQPASVAESEAFLQFVTEAAGEIKSIDGNTPVSIGLVNSSHVSPSGIDRQEYTKRLYRLVDIVSMHRYRDWSDDEFNKSDVDLAIAKNLGKDFFAGEIGLAFSAGQDRAAFFKKEIRFWKGAGAFSAMPWQFNIQQFGGMHEDTGISKVLGDFDALVKVMKDNA
jgi:endo-1,4-beta-mannosidase